jgi:hypothetical protein
MKFERNVFFEKGHDCLKFECIHDHATCAPGKGGSHGIGGVTIRWIVQGPDGAVQFVLYTGWMPMASDQSHYDGEAHKSIPADLGYHAMEPQYEDQEPHGPCEYLAGLDCYYDGSSLNAELPYRTLVNAGDKALWEFLEQYYMSVFEDGDFPDAVEYSKPERVSS